MPAAVAGAAAVAGVVAAAGAAVVAGAVAAAGPVAAVKPDQAVPTMPRVTQMVGTIIPTILTDMDTAWADTVAAIIMTTQPKMPTIPAVERASASMCHHRNTPHLDQVKQIYWPALTTLTVGDSTR